MYVNCVLWLMVPVYDFSIDDTLVYRSYRIKVLQTHGLSHFQLLLPACLDASHSVVLLTGT